MNPINLPPTDEKLMEALAGVKGYHLSAEEREAQRRSWSVGETMLAYPDMTRDEAGALYDKVVNSL